MTCTTDPDRSPSRRRSVQVAAALCAAALTVGCTADGETAQRRGSLESATAAVRAACREFYGTEILELFPEPGDDPTGTTALDDRALAARCDEPAVEWRSDCHDTTRPDGFEPSSGGCAHLGGYLAVRYGAGTGDGAGQVFDGLAGDEWTIAPESD